MLERESKEIGVLKRRVKEEAPEIGDTEQERTKFSEVALSQYTQQALKSGKFIQMTQIQKAAIPHALADRDVLGAAKTGSGKTLAFMIPVLEKLYRLRWGKEDGLGALVISPTRELAFQIFEVARQIGYKHSLSAGLVIGGKDLKQEQKHIRTMNILVATPGRILQHLEQTYGFSTDQLVMLVLDEADRILDMGFKKTLNAILRFMPPPPQRQTLLFSATQTRKVKDLARLSLNNPEYVAVHDKAEFATPKNLKQMYVVTPIKEKLNVLFSFIKTHLKDKILIFLSSCKQVKFVYECFRRIRPGTPLMALHGKVKQMKRLAIYEDFQHKKRAVLFATDVAARGLDFQKSPLSWVVQFDCPDTPESYIHRVGRTARFTKDGHALTVLLPSEEKMVDVLKEARVPMTKIELNPKRQLTIADQVRSFVAEDKDLKILAQKAFTSYVRSVHLQPNKNVFDVNSLELDDLASSMGLSSTPRVSFLKGGANSREESRNLRNQNSQLYQLKQSILMEKRMKRKEKKMKTFERAKITPFGLEEEEEEEKDEVLFKKTTKKRSHVELDDDDDDEVLKKNQNKRPKKLKIRSDRETENHFFFDETGEKRAVLESLADSSDVLSSDSKLMNLNVDRISSYQKRIAEQMNEADDEDREINRQRVKEKHRQKKIKARQAREDEGDDGGVMLGGATLGSAEVVDDDDESESESSSDSSSGEDDEEIDVSSAHEKALALLSRLKG